MKILFKLILLPAFVCMLALNCQSETDAIENEIDLKLKSPSGKELARDINELTDIIKSSTDRSISNIIFENIDYIEKENYTLGIVNYYEDDNFFSFLKVIDLDENYILLKDKKGLQIVKSNSSENNVKDTKSLYYFASRGSASCIGGECCTWEEINPDQFNCGCPDDPTSTSVIVTTSDGCKIEL